MKRVLLIGNMQSRYLERKKALYLLGVVGEPVELPSFLPTGGRFKGALQKG